LKIRKSAEDYLETMLILKNRHGYIRSVDIAEEMGVKKPSVTYATKRLKESGHITMDADSRITLTDAGMRVATTIYERHKLLTHLFVSLGVGEEIAREDACKIEHDLSAETFEAIRAHYERYGGAKMPAPPNAPV
jgi:DtxR family Mn-dependent transcriptional regulator